MKTLTVTALLCAVMALTTAAALPEEKPGEEPKERPLVKWSLFCPYGWTRYSGRCYRYISRAMSWGRAENNCLDLGGHLASVHNVLEYGEIQKVIMSFDLSSPRTWVGGYNAQEVNQWFWSDGTRLDFTLWAPGEPSNYQGKQQCIQMNFGDRKAWDDVECWTEFPSVCAK